MYTIYKNLSTILQMAFCQRYSNYNINKKNIHITYLKASYCTMSAVKIPFISLLIWGVSYFQSAGRRSRRNCSTPGTQSTAVPSALAWSSSDEFGVLLEAPSSPPVLHLAVLGVWNWPADCCSSTVLAFGARSGCKGCDI